MYLIVQFGEDVAIVPENWLDKDGTSAYWPPYKTDVRINKAALRKEPPSDGWSCETVTKVLYKNENYEKVKGKLKRSENTSDLQTTDDETVKRKRRPAKRLYETDSGADDNTSESDEDQDGRSASKRPATTTSCQSSSSTVASCLSTTITTTHPPATESACPPATASTCLPAISTTSTAGNRASTSLLLTPPLRIPTQALQASTPALQASTPNSGARLLGHAAVTKILTALEMMREEQREIKRLLQLLLSRGPAVEDQSCELPQGISFPIQSAEEMNEVDDRLVDADNLKSVVRYLSTFGGADVKELVDRFFKETISNDVGKLYNMKGLKGKLPFESLQLLNVLYRCVQRNAPTRTATRKDVQTEVAKWLTGSRDRAGGRKERVKRPVQVTVTPVNSDHEN